MRKCTEISRDIRRHQQALAALKEELHAAQLHASESRQLSWDRKHRIWLMRQNATFGEIAAHFGISPQRARMAHKEVEDRRALEEAARAALALAEVDSAVLEPIEIACLTCGLAIGQPCGHPTRLEQASLTKRGVSLLHLELPGRMAVALERRGIRFVGQLAHISHEYILGLPGFGDKALHRLCDAAERQGVVMPRKG